MNCGRAVAVVGAVLSLAACGEGRGVCPAVGWFDTLTVQLAEDWPDGEGRSVRLDCGGPCDPPVLSGDPSRLTAAWEGSTARFTVGMSVPDSVEVTVLGPDGAVLAEVDAAPDWVRVGGSEECGGPHEATVTVPAP